MDKHIMVLSNLPDLICTAGLATIVFWTFLPGKSPSPRHCKNLWSSQKIHISASPNDDIQCCCKCHDLAVACCIFGRIWNKIFYWDWTSIFSALLTNRRFTTNPVSRGTFESNFLQRWPLECFWMKSLDALSMFSNWTILKTSTVSNVKMFQKAGLLRNTKDLSSWRKH